ncbi:phage tail protein I [Microvirga alba]|uniref:Phage tail protein I n=1 Tax=Microvirga alba TaxID=2791025 RepID=A0A931BUX7_9HYPH|nr:phage tail protein I [Microvirga alba]MBF9235590.1 phage tail protein I [Microvirga alba]
MSDTLLPLNATAQERALDGATARLGDVPTPLRDVWNPDTCPASLLPWLAWAFGVDEWDSGWSEEAKRNTIRDAVMIQRRKGSVWSIKRAISAAGYGDSQLIEGNSNNFYNGVRLHNGFITYGDATEWARYRFVLTRPISNAQADQVRRLLDSVAPARCHLIELIFTEASNLYDGAIFYNGAFNHGVA